MAKSSTGSSSSKKNDKQFDLLSKESPLESKEVSAVTLQKKKTSTRTSTTAGKTSNSMGSRSTVRKTTATTKGKSQKRDEVIVIPSKTTTRKTSSTRAVRDSVVVLEGSSSKPKRTTSKTTSKKTSSSTRKTSTTRKSTSTVKTDNLEQEINAIVQELDIPVVPDEKLKVVEDSTFIEKEKDFLLDDFDLSDEPKPKKKTPKKKTKKSSNQTIEILHSGETAELEKIHTQEDTIEILHSGETSELEKIHTPEEDTIEILHSGETTELEKVSTPEEDTVEILHSGETAELDTIPDNDYQEDLDFLDQYHEKKASLEQEKKKKEKKKIQFNIPNFHKKKVEDFDTSSNSYQELEEDLRSLYDRVNDVVQDIDPSLEKEESIDLTKLRSVESTEIPKKKKFSFSTLKRNLSRKFQKIWKRPTKKPYDIQTRVQPKQEKAKKEWKFPKLHISRPKVSKPQIPQKQHVYPPEREKPRRVRVIEVEEYRTASILDYISQKVLNVFIILLSIIFILMCIAFVVFVVYISTF